MSDSFYLIDVATSGSIFFLLCIYILTYIHPFTGEVSSKSLKNAVPFSYALAATTTLNEFKDIYV